jgi:uncharacterized protein YjgD (DUF1641 family)
MYFFSSTNKNKNNLNKIKNIISEYKEYNVFLKNNLDKSNSYLQNFEKNLQELEKSIEPNFIEKLKKNWFCIVILLTIFFLATFLIIFF